MIYVVDGNGNSIHERKCGYNNYNCIVEWKNMLFKGLNNAFNFDIGDSNSTDEVFDIYDMFLVRLWG